MESNKETQIDEKRNKMAIIDLPDDENQASIVIMQQVQSDFECMNVVDDLPVESHHQL